MISAADVAATLTYLIPGFVATKLFYWLGLQGRRTDLELTLWSVLVAAGINAVLDRLALGPDPAFRLLVSVASGIGLGLTAAAGWNALSQHYPTLVVATSRRVWDVAFSGREARWVQVWTTGGHVIHGWYPHVALDANGADSLDILLRQPSWMSPTTNERIEMTGVSQVLVREAVIEAVQFLEWPSGTEPQ